MPKGKTSAGDDSRKRPAKKSDDDLDIDLDLDEALADVDEDGSENDDAKTEEDEIVIHAEPGKPVDLTGTVEVKPEENVEKPKKQDKKNIDDKVVDCRECANYPLRNLPSVSGIADDISLVTCKFTKKFCGIRPCDSPKFKNVSAKIDCRDKKFTPVNK